MAVQPNPPIQIDPSQDQSHQIAFINQNFHSLADSLVPYIQSDGSNNRLLIGKDSNGNYVVKISKAGYDAFNAAAANLAFDSSTDAFRIVLTGTQSISATGTAAVVDTTVTHNLGYRPYIFGGLNNGSSYYPLPVNTSATVSAAGIVFTEYIEFHTVTTTTFNIRHMRSAAGTATYTVTWYAAQQNVG